VSSSITWGTVTFTAGYDSVGRITTFGNGSASTNFSYDANGNRLTSGWTEAGSSGTFCVVLFPAPDGPKKPKISPRFISKFKFFKTISFDFGYE
jgi:YD repeat-containing protein